MLNHGTTNDNYFFFLCRVYNIMIFFIVQIFIFYHFNLWTVIIYRLVFPAIGRSTSIDRTTLATLNILNRNMMRLMVNSLLMFSSNLSISLCLLKMSSFKKLFSDSRYLTLSLINIKSSHVSVESSCTLPLIFQALI